jgi:hypothetical protein
MTAHSGAPPGNGAGAHGGAGAGGVEALGGGFDASTLTADPDSLPEACRLCPICRCHAECRGLVAAS